MTKPRSLAALPCLLVAIGCAAPMSSGAGTVEPLAARADTATPRPIATPSPDRPTIQIPSPLARDRAVRDSLAGARALADSLADAEALELLENAVAPGAAEAAEVPVTWDIDVTTYADHKRVQYYLDFFQSAGRERMAIWLERMPRYEPMIRQRLQEAKLPEDLVYLALIESGFSNTAVSRSRAVGIWQFMAGTARMFDLRIDRWVDDRRDPVKATDAAAKYLLMLTKQFGSPYVAAAAYNGGPGRISRGLNRVPGVLENTEGPGVADEAFFQLSGTRYIRQETKDYVPKLIAAALIAKQPERYGFHAVSAVEPYATDSVMVEDAVALDVIARLADTTVAAIKDLNPQYLRMITPPGRTSLVRLPVGTGTKAAAGLAALPASERVSFREHQIRKGETLGLIARKYHVTVDELLDANPRVKPRSLSIGQVLVVPTLGGPGSARTPPAPTRGAIATHTVRSGETLSGIATRYRTTTAALRALNELSSDLIRVGQELRVTARSDAPSAKPKTHTVRRGETLSELATRYGVSVNALMAANRLRSTAIRVGKRLTIPS